MWFKNLHFYEVEAPLQLESFEWDERLGTRAFQPALPSVEMSQGWINPLNETFESLHYAAEGFILFCLQIEKKILPASVVNEHLKEQIKRIELRDQRKIYRKEKLALKDEVFHTLLSRAFSAKRKIFGCYDTVQQRLWIDAPQRSMVEFFTAFLRETLGDLKLSLPAIPESITAQLTHWLLDQNLPEGFTVNDSCLLQNPQQEKGGVKILKQDLSSQTVQAFITEEHFFAKELSMQWQSYLTFTMKDDFSFKQFQFSDEVQSVAKEIESEDKIEQFASDFVVMAKTLRNFLTEMNHIFAIQEIESAAA